MSEETGFRQEGPVLPDPWESDPMLRGFVAREAPPDLRSAAEADLRRFATRAARELPALAADAERHEPRLVRFDPWGRRVDRIDVADGWRALHRVSAEEGLVALGHDAALGPFGRVWQLAKIYLFHPSSAFVSCPLAMTDGAARVLTLLGDDDLRRRAVPRLTARDPRAFWTSGQWMTERTGGSDVGRSETVARPDASGGYRLWGTKWFTSATTSEVAMTLARVEDAPGRADERLSLFFVETRDASGCLHDIEVLRLKDKLGTRALPTAELRLGGTPARAVGARGRGVADIAHLVNVTRIHNAICSAATMRRGLALARDWAGRRTAFGRRLTELPLHVRTLGELEVACRAACALAFETARLLGRVERGEAASGEPAELRLLTPIAKLATARWCVAAISETLEAFGGAGYVEDTGLPVLLRDAQVLPIWEGTTNVLALDAQRAIAREAALAPTLAAARRRLASLRGPDLAGAAEALGRGADGLETFAARAAGADPEAVAASARGFAFGLAWVAAGALLCEHAAWAAAHADPAEAARARAAADRWAAAPPGAPRLEAPDAGEVGLALNT